MIKYILYPFAVLYDAITRLRNAFFEHGVFKEVRFEIPTIGVGNLSVGGTGKTPMVEYLIRLLQNTHSLTTLSRGYKRSTKGFVLATAKTTVQEIGDEPSQFYFKYGEKIKVAVGEDRVLAIPQILFEHPETNAILLDDIFQHRHVLPNVLILLSTYDQPFYHDYLLPVGRLRESRKGAGRADAIIITKCPQDVDSVEKQAIKKKVAQYNTHAPLFFTSIQYGQLQTSEGQVMKLSAGQEVVLVSGLANSSQLEEHVSSQYKLIKHFKYPDHYHYKASDVQKMQSFIDAGDKKKRIPIITSEKDIVKLKSYDWTNYQLLYLPIEIVFQENEQEFQDFILSSV